MVSPDTISPPGASEDDMGGGEKAGAHEVFGGRHPAIEHHIRADIDGTLGEIPTVEERRREIAAREAEAGQTQVEAEQPQEPTEQQGA